MGPVLRTRPKPRRVGRVGRLVLATIATALAGVVVWRLGPRPAEVADALAGARPWPALAALGVNCGAVFVRSESWRRIVRHSVERTTRARDTYVAYVIGLLVNLLVPARAGEAVRVASLCGRIRAGRAMWMPVAGTVIAHRLLAAVPLAALTVTALLATDAAPGGAGRTAAVAAVLVALLILATIAGRRFATGDSPGPIRRAFARLSLGLGGLGSPRVVVPAAALECLAWALQLAVVWLGMQAFGVSTSVAAAAVVLLATNIATMIPAWPGAIGLFQAAVALALGPFGVPYAVGIAFGIGLQAIELVSTLLLGVPVAAGEGISLRQVRAAARAADRAPEASAVSSPSHRPCSSSHEGPSSTTGESA